MSKTACGRCCSLGSGGSFCSGLDLKAAVEMVQSMHTADGSVPGLSNEERMRHYFHGVIRACAVCPSPCWPTSMVQRPVSVAIWRWPRSARRNGAGQLCRAVCASRPDARRRLDLHPAAPGRRRQSARADDARRHRGAPEAQRLGLLNAVVDSDEAAAAYAQRPAAGPPLVLRAIGRGLRRARRQPGRSAEGEVRGQMGLLRTADFAEGMNAFFNKRPPHFTGH